jgi:hypothetical protein
MSGFGTRTGKPHLAIPHALPHILDIARLSGWAGLAVVLQSLRDKGMLWFCSEFSIPLQTGLSQLVCARVKLSFHGW